MIQRPLRLWTENDPLAQPKDSSPYIKNANPKRDKSGNSNEESVEAFTQTDANETCVGFRYLDENKMLTFWASEFNDSSKILLLDNKGNQKVILDDPRLGFSCDYQISCEAKVNIEGETVIYWCDPKIRFLNIDDPKPNLTLAKGLATDDDLEKLNIFYNIQIPEMELSSIQTGGTLKAGSYSFFIAYEDNDGNYTNFVSTGNPIPIHASTNTGIVNDGYASEYDGTATGEVTGKLIKLEFTNLDANYEKFRVVAIRSEGGIYYPELVGIYSVANSVPVVYAAEGDAVSLNDVLIPTPSYTEGKAMTQIGKTLLITGLKTDKEYDFQPYANNIKIDWITEPIEVGTMDGYKNEEIIFRLKSYQQDEVYAFFIHPIYLDGRVGAGFHIPGRQKNNITLTDNDTATDYEYAENELMSVINNNSAIKNEFPFVEQGIDVLGNETRLYHMTNTALDRDDAFNMGYWENINETYPNEDRFNGTIVNGNGVDLRGQKVRHHRMPSIGNKIKRINGYAEAIGIRVSDIQVPDELKSRIQGFKITYAKRNISNSLVVGEGTPIMTEDSDTTESTNVGIPAYYNYSTSRTINAKVLKLHCFDLLREKPSISGVNMIRNYLSYQETVSLIGTTNWEATKGYQPIKFNISPQNVNSSADVCRKLTLAASDSGSFVNNREKVNARVTCAYIRHGAKLAPKALTGLTRDIVNTGGEQFIAVETNIEDFGLGGYELSQTEGVEQNNVSFTIAGLLSIKQDCYLAWDSLELIDTGVNIPITFPMSSLRLNTETYGADVFGGDVFICPYYTRLTAKYEDDKFTSPDEPRQVKSQLVTIVSSKDNLDYRHEGIESYQIYRPKSAIDTVLDQETWVDNSYLYNIDYSNLNDLQPLYANGFEIPFTSDVFKNRTIISNKENLETLADGYRTFLANNYHDLVNRHGKIVDVLGFGNKVLIHTDKAIYVTVTSDKIQLGTVEAYLGTGDVFSLEPTEAIPYDGGIGGKQSIYSGVLTPYGYFFADANDKKVYLFQDKLLNLTASQLGMSNKFDKVLNFDLDDAVFTKGVTKHNFTLEKDNPHSIYGIGLLAGYDPKYKRMFLTKKDYTPTGQFTNNYKGLYSAFTLYNTGEIVAYNGKLWRYTGSTLTPNTESFTHTGGNYFVRLELIDDLYFSPNILTVSYDPETQVWLSYHDYTPQLYANNDVDMFTMNRSSVYKHNKEGDYGKVYNLQNSLILTKPFVIQAVGNSIQEYTLDSFFIKSKYFNGDKIEHLKTFEKYVVFNDVQCSRLEDIILRESARYYEGRMNVHRFKDFVADESLPFVITDTNVTNVADKLHFSQKRRIKGAYVIIQLYFSNLDNNSLTLQQVGYKFR